MFTFTLYFISCVFCTLCFHSVQKQSRHSGMPGHPTLKQKGLQHKSGACAGLYLHPVAIVPFFVFFFPFSMWSLVSTF